MSKFTVGQKGAESFVTTLGARVEVWNVPTDDLPSQMSTGTVIMRISMDEPGDSREALVALSPMDQMRLVNGLEKLRQERQGT